MDPHDGKFHGDVAATMEMPLMRMHVVGDDFIQMLRGTSEAAYSLL
jgi:hypothetical protein